LCGVTDYGNPDFTFVTGHRFSLLVPTLSVRSILGGFSASCLNFEHCVEVVVGFL
jgi:hypothetical protein